MKRGSSSREDSTKSENEPTVKKPRAEINENEPTLKKPRAEINENEPTLKNPRAEINENEPTLKKPKAQINKNEPTLKKPRAEINYEKFRSTPIDKFRLTPINKFDKKLPNFRDPREIGSFSQDYKRNFHADKRQLKSLIKLPYKTVEFDLNKGYKEMIRRDEISPEQINDLLRWIMHKPEAFQLHSEKHSSEDQPTKLSSLNTDFVCWRGLMTRLVCTPYENRDDWKIAVIRFRNTYFLCEFMTEDRKKQVANTTPRQDEMSYWGWKFEQYITSAEKGGTPDINRPINTNEAFCSVVRSRLGEHSLVYGGEIDGIDDSLQSDSKYVEFKTSRQIEYKKQNINFQRHKLIKYWAQSHLVGISKIICGFRDDDGIVHELKEFQTEKIPDNLQDLYNPWKPNVCMNFVNEILEFIKDSIKTNDSKSVYLLEWRPYSDVTLKKTTDPQYNFLPDWFTTWDGWREEDTT